MQRTSIKLSRGGLVSLIALLGVVLLGLASVRLVIAQDDDGGAPAEYGSPISPIHPTFPLLDASGENVLDSGAPVSTMNTCGACHDTAFIAEHSFHADVGLEQLVTPGGIEGSRPWDISPGLFGKWNPLEYRYLSPAGDETVDLTTPEWLQLFGARHAGGGPAMTSRAGLPLITLSADPDSVETSVVNPESGGSVPWDWDESGVVEMNCFLCHTPEPDNEERMAALAAGDFAWANTATLANSGWVERDGDGWAWNGDAFDEEGNLDPEFVKIQDPTDTNCGQCHGVVHSDARSPLVIDACTTDQWSTLTTGQVFSPQQIASSGLNLASKETLARSWDIHAERVVGCTDCHHALNNPVYYKDDSGSAPEHLTFDPRRIDIGEYLLRPIHQFAKGSSAQGTLAQQFDDTLRRCESCHDIESTHDWLPYKERHTTALSCESCHVPELYAPAQQSINWTALRADGTPLSTCRGVAPDEGSGGAPLIEPFQPVLLPRANGDGTTSLAPYNIVTSWYWVYGSEEAPRPVPLRDLQAAWLTPDGAYRSDIVDAFDADGDGRLSDAELVIDSDAKETLIAGKLRELDLEAPRIHSEAQPYNIHHSVAGAEWAVKDCQACHAKESRITAAMVLANDVPGGVLPTVFADETTALRGDIVTDSDGALRYQPRTDADGDSGLASLYILGHDAVDLIDWLGVLLFVGTLAGVTIHGGLRLVAARRQLPHDPELREVYMYSVYERLWHWLQTLVIFGLLFTGLIIHKPDKFGIFSFRYVVEVHNILAGILLVNAALAAFYHVASGEIRQYLPRPRGFFDQAITQATFYVRGIFRGEPHPFDKTRERKLNPLQQITYFGLLNVLLPAQVITGILMWGVQRWPSIALSLGGLPFLAPVHTLVAWLFASFIVMHVYLTTTGHTATGNIRAMIMGWDEVEVQPQATEA